MFWPMMTSSQEPHFLVNFWDFSKNFSKILPQNLQHLDKNFQLFKEIFTKINVILFLWHHVKGHDLCLDFGTFLQSFISLVG